MLDAIDELVGRSVQDPELLRFHAFHKEHPEVLDFLVAEIRLRLERGFRAYSNASLMHYARWKLELTTGPATTYTINDHVTPFYGRAIVILHPEFNGRCESRTSGADRIFGVMLEPVPKKRPKHYARRLVWADGKALESGWRPTTPHVVTHAAKRKPDLH